MTVEILAVEVCFVRNVGRRQRHNLHRSMIPVLLGFFSDHQMIVSDGAAVAALEDVLAFTAPMSTSPMQHR